MSEIEVVSPLNGKTIANIAETSTKELGEKIERARKAQKSWAALGIKNRSQIFYRYHSLLQNHRQSLVDTIHLENGKTKDEALAEVEKAIEVTQFACSLPQVLVDESLEVSRGVQCTLTHRPLGVVASVTPFNFPVMIPHWTVPIALMLGNAMLLKPSEVVPMSALKMMELAHEAGVPEEIFQVILGGASTVETLCQHDNIEAVSFVGSTSVAKKVYRLATSHLKRALCLGRAKNHLVVLPDADIEMTASNVVASMSGMAGQRCMAASVMVAVGDIDPIVDRIIDLAKDVVPGKNLGAIISEPAKRRIESYIESASQTGAKVRLDGRKAQVVGGEGGFYLGPSVIDHVQAGTNLAQDEIFGPVLSILRCKDVDEAIAIQNQSQYGNGASVYTNSGSLAKYVRENMSAGMIGTNIGVPVPREPFSFGGMKASKFGVGDITGKSSLNFWSNPVKYTTKWNREAGINWMS